MLATMTKLLALIGIGVLWRYTKPMQLSAGQMLRPMLALLYSVLLPALVLTELWKAPLNSTTFKILVVVVGATAAAMAAIWFLFRVKNFSPQQKGALLLAGAFGNVLILGMPVTQKLVSGWTSRTAVEFEMFAVIPLVFTAALVMISQFSGNKGKIQLSTDIIKEPIVWAAILGLLLNMADVRYSGWIVGFAGMIQLAIIPIGLIAVGLALNWNPQWNKSLPQLLMIAAIQLILVPLVLVLLAKIVGLKAPQTFKSLVLQAAMPAMLFGFVLCDRYKLDTTSYTAAFSLTTGLAIISVPIWHWLLRSGL